MSSPVPVDLGGGVSAERLKVVRHWGRPIVSTIEEPGDSPIFRKATEEMRFSFSRVYLPSEHPKERNEDLISAFEWLCTPAAA